MCQAKCPPGMSDCSALCTPNAADCTLSVRDTASSVGSLALSIATAGNHLDMQSVVKGLGPEVLKVADTVCEKPRFAEFLV